MDKPAFDPSQPFQPADSSGSSQGSKPAFDPSQPYDNVPGSSTNPAISKLVDNFSLPEYNKLSPEDKDQFVKEWKEDQANTIAAVSRGVEKGAGLPFEVASWAANKISPGSGDSITPAALSSGFEKNVVAPIGDALTGNDTSELYNNSSPAQRELEYNKQISDATNKPGYKGPALLGNLVGSAPTYMLGGAAAGAAAEGLGAAANAGKLGQAAINIPAQAGTNAAIAGAQGYNSDPNANEATKEANQNRGALIGGGLGGLGAAAGEVPGAISALGKNSSNKVLANASLGAEGVNTATQAGREAITAKGEALAGKVAQGVTDLNETLGKQAAGEIQHIFASTAKDAQTSVEDIVNQVSNNLDTIAKTSGQASMDTINSSFAQALKQTGEQQGLTGAKLTSFIQEGLNKYGPIIGNEIKNAAASGTQVPVSENFLKTFLAIKNAKVSLPGAETVQNNLWKNWADTLYDVSENTVKQSKGTIPGGANVSEVAVSGKGVLPSQLPAPQAQPEFVAGAQGGQQQLAANIAKNGTPGMPAAPEAPPAAPQPEAPPAAPQAAAPAPQPGVNAPLNVTTNKAATSTAGQFENAPYSSQSGTQVNQTFTPKAQIPVDEAKQLAGAMGNASQTPEIGYMAADLSSQLKKGLQSTLGEGYADATAKYSSLKSAAEEMGVPKIQADKLTGDSITPDGISAFIQKAAKMADQGDTASLDRVYGHLNEVDPTFAANFKTEVDQVSRQMSALKKSANAAPLDKASVLQQQGLATPQVNQAAENLQNLGQVQKQVGTVVPKIREFIEGLNPSDIGSKNDLDQLLGLLDKVDPQTAALLRSKASQAAVGKSNLLSGGANQSPLEQFNLLKQAGANSDVAEKAAQNLENLDITNKNIGGTTNLGTPSDTTRDFIKNFGKSSDTPSGSATSTDIDAIVQKLSAIDPTLAATVKAEAPTVGRQLRAIDYSQSGSGMGSNVATKALGGIGAVAAKGANVVGQASRGLAAGPGIGRAATQVASSHYGNANNGGSNDLQKLADVVQNSPEQLGEFAEPLKEAAGRGSNALAAMHFALYSSDPKYRAIIDPIQAMGQKQPNNQ